MYRLYLAKRRLAVIAPLLVLMAACLGQVREVPTTQPSGPAASEDGISVYFSPGGGAQDAIIAEIGKAQKSIDMQAYVFTSVEIAKALVAAKDRGVVVRAILDNDAAGQRYSGATFLANNGVKTWLDGRHAIAHSKVIIIDGETILTGSFNFTKAAEERNAENLLIITGKKEVAAAYLTEFEEHLTHSDVYAGVNAKDK